MGEGKGRGQTADTYLCLRGESLTRSGGRLLPARAGGRGGRARVHFTGTFGYSNGIPEPSSSKGRIEIWEQGTEKGRQGAGAWAGGRGRGLLRRFEVTPLVAITVTYMCLA